MTDSPWSRAALMVAGVAAVLGLAAVPVQG